MELNSPIAAGETKDLTLKITSKLFSEERMIPLDDPQQFIAGLLQFENAQGGQQPVTVRTSIIPTQFRSQFRP